MANKEKHLIIIVGPTAIGKTSLSVGLAHYLNCEILSADSRQFFKELAIGTAKPSLEEQNGIKHHFIDSLSIHDEYNVGQFEQDALEVLNEIFKSSDIAIMVGGSGLYVDSICYGIDDIPKDDIVRQQLIKQLETEGIESLQKELQILDPEHYAIMNTKNPQRLIRALEVCKATGKTYSSFRKNQSKARPFRIHKIGLTAERELIYNNINKRVDQMMENGLLDEAKSVYPFKSLNSLNTVGYKELFQYFDGKITLEEAIELIKKNTRNFAKRQLTWFKKKDDTVWFDYQTNTTEILAFLKNQIEI